MFCGKLSAWGGAHAVAAGRICCWLGAIAGLVLLWAVGCSKQPNEAEMPGRMAPQRQLLKPIAIESLSTSGEDLVGIGGYDGGIAVWRWSDLDVAPLVERFHSLTAAWLQPGIVVSQLWDPEHPEAETDPVAWDPAKGARSTWLALGDQWYLDQLRTSQNGKWLCILVRWAKSRPHRYDRRLGVAGMDLKEVHWLATMSGQYLTINAVAVSEDGRLAIAAGVNNGGWVLLADVEKGTTVWETVVPHSVSMADVAFSPDGSVIYAGGGAGRLYAMDAATGRVIRHMTIGEGREAEYGHRITTVACSLDGRLVAAGTGPRGEVYVWDARSAKRLMTINTQDATVMGLAFSPDSQLLATRGVAGRTVKVWQMPRSEGAEHRAQEPKTGEQEPG